MAGLLVMVSWIVVAGYVGHMNGSMVGWLTRHLVGWLLCVIRYLCLLDRWLIGISLLGGMVGC